MFPNILPANQKSLLAALGQQPFLADYYLAGGTALALQLGHRLSVDLDFFCSGKIISDQLKQHLSRIQPLEIRNESDGTLHGVMNGVQLSFIEYPYPHLQAVELYEQVQLASLPDIACMKIAAVTGRSTKKDFVDLYFLSQHKLDLQAIWSLMDKKFPNVSYSAYHVLRSLVYFQEAEQTEMPKMLVSCGWEEVKRYFAREVPRLGKFI